jgi:hypothetical protein
MLPQACPARHSVVAHMAWSPIQQGTPHRSDPWTAMGCSGVGIPYNCADVSEAIDRHPHWSRTVASLVARRRLSAACNRAERQPFRLREHAALRCNLACWRRSGPSRNFATAVAQAPRRQFPECVSSRCCADRPQRLAASPDGRRLPRGRSWLRTRQVGSPLTDLHRDWALPSRSCPGTGLT